MKLFYQSTFRNLAIGCAMLVSSSIFAQTNPTPQSIPYTQDFSGLTHASTTYPAGIQGWKVSSAATTSFVTTGPTGDQLLLASSSASSTAGGVHNYNGKVGTLASGSTNPGIALALNTTGKSNIRVNYDIMVIRNPYDGAGNTRLNEATLQYRIGTSGAFTTLTGIEYQSGTTTQVTSGVTTPQNLTAKSIVLPAACDNQAEIQIRWITRDMTGAGSRPSFAVDNIDIDADSDLDTYYSAVDCNDNDASVNPGATEICNFIDDDCDGIVDDGITYLGYYTDADIDGFGAGLAANYCTDPGAGFSLSNDDCDDADNTVYPGAIDLCNGIDNDCDGNIDEDALFSTYFLDNDGDTYGNALDAGTTFCNTPGAAYVLDNTDCDDSQPTVYPGAAEICDGLDNNCNGNTDEDVVSASISPAGVINTCKGVGVTLTANAGDGYTYQWFKNGNAIVGATFDTYNTSKPAYYQVQVTTPGGCFALSEIVEVNTAPNPNANITYANGLNLCAPTVKLKASYGATYTYQWYLDGSPIGGATNYTYVPTVVGNYYCTVTNEFDCSRNTLTVEVVNVCREAEVVALNNIAIYPNPSTDVTTILFETNSSSNTASIAMYNMIGENVYTNNATIVNGTITHQLNVAEFVAGAYVVAVNVDGIIITTNLMVTK